MNGFLSFARGPLFTACFLFMVIGLLRHVVLRVRDLLRVRRRTPKRDVPWRQIVGGTVSWALPVRHLLRQTPLLSISSIFLHLGVVTVPIFLAGHSRLWARAVGIRIPALSHGAADALTLIAIAAGAALFVIRLVRKPARALSRLSDYLLLLAVLVPFVSGYLAVHPAAVPFSYSSLMLVHVLSANLLFVLMPTTKLAHVVLFLFDRLSGDIFWRLVPGAGDRVGEALRGHRMGAEA
jgi:nitrate reductase gamma subunit